MPFQLHDRSGGNRIGEKGVITDADTGAEYEYRKINNGLFKVALVPSFEGVRLKAVDVFALRNEMELIRISAKYGDSPETIVRETNSETDRVLAEIAVEN
jgi:hypothetical protein